MKNRVIIIAEIGVNHNGKIDIAKKLIKSAKKSGADFVKFQTFNVDELVKKNSPMANYQKKNLGKRITQYQMLKKYEINKLFHDKIISYCKKIKIRFLTSPFDLLSIDLISKYKFKYIKIPSGEITNIPYLRKIGKLNITTFLSSGMSSLEEVRKALITLTKSGMRKEKIYVLHCHTDYPSNYEDLNLHSINFIKKKLKTKVGYSDHSLGSEAAIVAVALGAKVIEKHITLNNRLPGPDHKASMSITDFTKFVRSIRNVEQALGKFQKFPSKKELKIMKLVRKSIYAKTKIKKGEKFTINNLVTRRPMASMPASNWDKIIGKVSQKNFKKNQQIS